MSFGTLATYADPGLVQVFLNMQVFGMNIQQAIEAPRFRSMRCRPLLPARSLPATLWLESSCKRTVVDFRSALHVLEYNWDTVWLGWSGDPTDGS